MTHDQLVGCKVFIVDTGASDVIREIHGILATLESGLTVPIAELRVTTRQMYQNRLGKNIVDMTDEERYELIVESRRDRHNTMETSREVLGMKKTRKKKEPKEKATKITQPRTSRKKKSGVSASDINFLVNMGLSPEQIQILKDRIAERQGTK